MKKQKAVWITIGSMINGTEEQINKLLAGDGSELVAMIQNGQLDLKNGPYAHISDASVEAYNEANGTDIQTKDINITIQ